MATLLELNNLSSDPDLKSKCASAVKIVAYEISQEDSGTPFHTERLAWAKQVWNDPNGAADDLLQALLGANSSLSLAQIQGASDAAILDAVRNVVNVFAG